jgi:hypothetical protein
MPAVILLVAAALLVWSRVRAARAVAEVEHFVVQVVNDGPPIGAPEVPGLEEQLGAFRDQAISVRVVAGDVAFGDGSATHHAIVEVGGSPQLGLRLVHVHGEPPAIAVVGYWTP